MLRIGAVARNELRPRPAASSRPGSEDQAATAAMARWLGIFFASGGTLALAALALPHTPYPNMVATALLSASAYPVAAFLLLTRREISTRVFHTLTAAGTLVVTLGIVLGRGSPLALVSPMFYLWVPIFAITYFPTRAAIAHVVWIALSYSAAVSVDADRYSLSQWIVVIGVLTVTSCAVHSLVSEIRRLARTDHLTGLANRRAFDDRLNAEITRVHRTQTTLCVAIIDLDDFKRVNDRHGHQVGDQLLIRIARAWLPELRGIDCLARYGGDEFALLLPDSNEPDAIRIIERIRAALPTASFCVGVASYTAGDDQDTLISRADHRLYDQKRTRTRTSPASRPSP